jgi:hypothetical protein
MDHFLWQDMKNLITNTFPIAHDSLHVLAGLAIHLAVSWAAKKPLHWWGAVATVACIETFAEFMDSFADAEVYGMWIWRESLKDFALTVAPSVMVFLYSRFRRS